jgi:hypothetical protein
LCCCDTARAAAHAGGNDYKAAGQQDAAAGQGENLAHLDQPLL